MVLDRIKAPNDVKKLNSREQVQLAAEIREFLINSIAKTGGHLASNLGVVELTIALHLVTDPTVDRIIWDVGHQAYTHKILTGRKNEFEHLRQAGGISGFPKRSESVCDAFDTGHSSNSISAGLGMVMARDLTGDKYKVISVIGDGSMTGGMAFEALNNLSGLKRNFVIVLNDNEMSISQNVGGLSAQLSRFRTSENYVGLKENVAQSLEKIPKYGEKLVTGIHNAKSGIKQMVIPGMIFEDMDIMYLGPVDGHDIKAMTKVLKEALAYNGPVLVHVKTKKGRGYEPAERHPSRFHGIGPYNVENGLPLGTGNPGYTDVFSTIMKKQGERNDRVVAVTAAMEDGTGLRRFHNAFPERFFDVGIAEEHAVTFCAAMADRGMHPVFAVYSAFLQRAYDQIIVDVAMQKLPVTFAIDRAGLVGADGETHQGIFDLSYMTAIPNMVVMAPKNKWELSDMVKWSVDYDGPSSIRYPRGEAQTCLKDHRSDIELGHAEIIYDGGDVLLFAIGSMVETAEEVRTLLAENGISAAVVNARFAKPIDEETLLAYRNMGCIVTMEENVLTGGFGMQCSSLLMKDGYEGRILNIALPDAFIEHGSVADLKKKYGLDAESIAHRITDALAEEAFTEDDMEV